jgi:hypothetical protein
MRSLALQPGELLTSLPGGFVNGLHGVGFPLPCHSSYEGLTLSLGRTFTGWNTASLSGRADWPPALAAVQPETFQRWRRQGCHLFWRDASCSGRPAIPVELQRLIRQMARDNLT